MLSRYAMCETKTTRTVLVKWEKTEEDLVIFNGY